MIDLGSELFFNTEHQPGAVTAYKLVTQLAIMILPILVIKLNAKWGNLNVTSISLLIFSMISALILLDSWFLYSYLFMFPIVVRFFNSSTNPYIIKETPKKIRSKVLSVRDFFLYLGISLGSLFCAYFRAQNMGFYQIFKLSLIILAVILIFIGRYTWKRRKNLKLVSEGSKNEHEVQKISSYKEMTNKRNLIVQLLIAILTAWIGTAFSFLASIFFINGFNTTDIFESFGYGYLFVAILSIISSVALKNPNKKGIYLFDLIFDIVPLNLVLISGQSQVLMIISVLILMARDFVKPLSMDYTFSCFSDHEIDYVWGVLGTVPAVFTLGFTILMKFIVFNWDWKVAFYVSLICSLGSFILAYYYLPKLKTEIK